MEITVSQGKSIVIDEEIAACECGGEYSFHMGYGPKPYSINCKKCRVYISNEITCCTPTCAIKAFNAWLIDPDENKFNFRKIYNSPVANVIFKK